MSNLIVKSNGLEKRDAFENNALPSLSSWVDDLFNKSFAKDFVSNFNSGMTLPAVNVKDNANDYIVEMAIPGLKKSDFNIDLDNKVLSVSAETSSQIEEEQSNYSRREFGYSSFKRTFNLPDTVEQDKITANYTDGILNILLPKRDEAKKKPAKSIKVS
jgi:HSP20 family protein